MQWVLWFWGLVWVGACWLWVAAEFAARAAALAWLVRCLRGKGS